MLTDLVLSELLTWRPLSPAAVDLWHPLYEAAREADHGVEHLTGEDLGDELAAAWVDLEHDTVLGLDEDGVARAFGLVQIRPGDVTTLRAHAWGAVHPQWRGRGIGRSLLRWQEVRARALVAARREAVRGDVPAYLWVAVDEGVDGAARLARRQGLELTRWFSDMRRDLDLPGPHVDRVLPGALRLVGWEAALDDALRLAHNEAFLDHWGFQPWSVEAWQQWESGYRYFRPDWTVAVLAGEDVVAYATGAAFTPDWLAQGYTEGWTNKVGVRREWRGRGLARLLLATQMDAFRRDGVQYAGLGVDTENLTGAMRLYTGLGYESRHRSATWSKDL